MDKVTQSTAANAEETASAAEELNAQSEVLRDAVNQLQKLITGHSSDESRVTHQASRPVRTVSAAGRTVIRAKPSPKGDSHKADIIPMPTGSEGKASVNAPGEMDFRNF
jgi:methyl-accepting chemotaxis protein